MLIRHSNSRKPEYVQATQRALVSCGDTFQMLSPDGIRLYFRGDNAQYMSYANRLTQTSYPQFVKLLDNSGANIRDMSCEFDTAFIEYDGQCKNEDFNGYEPPVLSDMQAGLLRLGAVKNTYSEVGESVDFPGTPRVLGDWHVCIISPTSWPPHRRKWQSLCRGKTATFAIAYQYANPEDGQLGQLDIRLSGLSVEGVRHSWVKTGISDRLGFNNTDEPWHWVRMGLGNRAEYFGTFTNNLWAICTQEQQDLTWARGGEGRANGPQDFSEFFTSVEGRWIEEIKAGDGYCMIIPATAQDLSDAQLYAWGRTGSYWDGTRGQINDNTMFYVIPNGIGVPLEKRVPGGSPYLGKLGFTKLTNNGATCFATGDTPYRLSNRSVAGIHANGKPFIYLCGMPLVSALTTPGPFDQYKNVNMLIPGPLPVKSIPLESDSEIVDMAASSDLSNPTRACCIWTCQDGTMWEWDTSHKVKQILIEED